ncbi:trypsin-1-like [Manduca sexta]|uniref:Phenoloxidase-activating factor 2 n=1 Tax=Manduca sexta TaxID=7130 RepID=A0A922CGF4_MANSE|nr:trypsin-1 [Manduca sexta]XP_037296985.1 trypsin-1 [Manduca sexta]XP_037303236.1 trypsin-1-like [Manduca sexta]KAG6445009.1 hypothetical protein O3G_MSEX003689 [Manduca sexta]KAG6445010.1 hypothetical protein O3G_MSEX003689 [Manduca sexta]
MKWLLVLVCVLGLTSCQTPSPNPALKEKGLIEWISNLFSSTTISPVHDPPEDCPTCQCGIARTRRRIVGGYETKQQYYPWMAVLMYNGRFYCGGSLLNDLYVLTAAHCTAGFRKEKITVRFLEHDRSQVNETKTIDRKVSAIIRHLRYNPGTYDNDIALLKLEERVDLSSALKKVRRDGNSTEPEENQDVGLRPVCLPKGGLSYTNYTAVVTGWGTTEEGGSVSDTLQEVKVPIVSNDECRKGYGGRITENMICAGEKEGGKDACQGDSGGPMHIVDENGNKYREVGVVSWGEGCARPDKYGVYSRVNRYLTWIEKNTKDACYCQ